MRSEQLKYLIDISNSPSINAASEKLHISYQALSHSIKALEDELNLSLLVRTNQGSVLTEDGKKVVALAKRFFSGIEQIQVQKNIDAAQINGTVNILTTNICLENFLFDLMDVCKRNYPKIKFHYELPAYGKESAFHLLRKDPSCFFLSIWGLDSYNSEIPDDIQKTIIAHTNVKCVCSPMHELANYQSVSFKKLKKYDLLVRHSAEVDDVPLKSFKSVVSENNPVLFEKKILSENYISFIYKIPFAPYWIPRVDNVARIDVHTESDVHLALCCNKNAKFPPQTKAFLELLYQTFGVKDPKNI